MNRPTFGTDPTWHRQEKYKRYHGDNGAKPRAKMAVVQALRTLNSTHGFVPVGMILKQDPALTRPSVHRVLLELEREACLVTRGSRSNSIFASTAWARLPTTSASWCCHPMTCDQRQKQNAACITCIWNYRVEDRCTLKPKQPINRMGSPYIYAWQLARPNEYGHFANLLAQGGPALAHP
ncbi:hypothetical protein [Pseudomonas pergaminensis]|uniref:Helix-turn-helix domain-containing protein n=1 Tax=Pseudomonas pergaminensis TaxID=2853159 RepID=A0ABW8R9Z7_9PSED